MFWVVSDFPALVFAFPLWASVHGKLTTGQIRAEGTISTPKMLQRGWKSEELGIIPKKEVKTELGATCSFFCSQQEYMKTLPSSSRHVTFDVGDVAVAAVHLHPLLHGAHHDLFRKLLGILQQHRVGPRGAARWTPLLRGNQTGLLAPGSVLILGHGVTLLGFNAAHSPGDAVQGEGLQVLDSHTCIFAARRCIPELDSSSAAGKQKRREIKQLDGGKWKKGPLNLWPV